MLIVCVIFFLFSLMVCIWFIFCFVFLYINFINLRWLFVFFFGGCIVILSMSLRFVNVKELFLFLVDKRWCNSCMVRKVWVEFMDLGILIWWFIFVVFLCFFIWLKNFLKLVIKFFFLGGWVFLILRVLNWSKVL